MITDVERLALATLNTKDLKEARDGVVPGKYEVDVTVRVTGTLTVAPDTEVSPTASLPTQLLLVQLLKRMGHTRESAVLLLSELTDTANGLSPAEKKKLVSESGYDEAEAVYKANVTAKLGKSPRRGAVKNDSTYTVLSASETAVLAQLAPESRNAPSAIDTESALDELAL